MTVSSNYANAYSSYNSSATSSSKQTDRPSFEDFTKELLSSMDTDNSGSIDKAEFSAAAQALASNSNSTNANNTSSTASAADIFNTLDTNSDGSMSSEELMTALKNSKPPEPPRGEDGGMPPPPPGGMPPSGSSSASSESESTTGKIFAALDTNKDGTVSMDELAVLFEKDSTDSSTSTSESAQTATSSAETKSEDAFKNMRNDMLQKILSYYGNNATSSSTTSLLSLSA